MMQHPTDTGTVGRATPAPVLATAPAPIANLLTMVNPFKDDPWGVGDIDPGEVRQAVTEGRLNAEAHDHAAPWTRAQHVERIAWLVVHGWTDPMIARVCIPSLGCADTAIRVADGLHRLAAAVVRGDTTIEFGSQPCTACRGGTASG